MNKTENFYPIEDKIIAKEKTGEVTTAGGLILPDLEQQQAIFAEVVSVGPGRHIDNEKRIPMSCKVGDTIIIPKFGAHKFEYDGTEYLILRESDILVRIGNPEKTILKG